MSGLDNIIHIKIEEIFSKQKFPKRVAVAVSGGADSLALTILLHDFCRVKKSKLFAVTVDHKVRPSSTKEALQLNKILNKAGIDHEILAIKWLKKPQSNIEAQLREARYKLLGEFCVKNKINHLFLGHQLDDIAENFLIRLFRGSGLDGLSTMATISEFNKIKLVRPLLDVTKSELKEFLQQKKIKWFEDETNADEKFLRNKIRNFFAQLPDKDLIQKRIKNSTDEIAKMRDLFDLEMLEQAKQVLDFTGNSFLLNLEKFKKVEEKIALKIIALVAIEISGKAYKPRLERLKIFYDWILLDQNHKARDFYGCIAKKQAQAIAISSKQGDKVALNTILKRIF